MTPVPSHVCARRALLTALHDLTLATFTGATEALITWLLHR
ncbi:hypothetical protein [Streptomyces sp. NPDC058086]